MGIIAIFCGIAKGYSMAELIDIYTEDGRYVGVADRNVAHTFALWHKTVHCWLINGNNIIFQKRGSALKDNPGKLYTTASGHISAGETVEQGFMRETAEEFGIQIAHPTKLSEHKWTGDFKKTDGTEFHDRVFANIFFSETDIPIDQFKPQADELDGLVEMDMNGALDLFEGKIDSLAAKGYLLDGGGIDPEFRLKDIEVTRDDFLCFPPDTLDGKFGKVIKWILGHKK